MNEENKNVNEQIQEQRVDPRNIEAEVIGELRKEKIGKPILAIEMLILLIVVLISLPMMYKMFNDETSDLYKVLHPNTNVNTPTNPDTPKNDFLDGSELQLLASSTTMKFENLVIKNMITSGTTIECIMYSYNGVINLDEEPLYLEIYSTSEQLIASVKLSGTLDYQETKKVLTANGLSFNNTLKYFAKVVRMSDGMYPNISIEEDENEIGSFTCTLDNRSIKYTFKNGYLLSVTDVEKIGYETYPTNDEYLAVLKQYRTKVENIGNEYAKVEETEDGFIYTALLDYESGYRLPNSVNDYNYYSADSEAKIIHYAQSGKGFDCK